MSGIGRKRITISLRMLADALAYQKATMLTQVPSRVRSQLRAMGLHWKMVAMMVDTAYPETKVKTSFTARRKFLFGKILRYRSRIDILVKFKVILYAIWQAQKVWIHISDFASNLRIGRRTWSAGCKFSGATNCVALPYPLATPSL